MFMDISKFREDLSAAMQENSWTQVALSQLAGVPQNSISRFMSGSRQSLSLQNALRLWPFIYGHDKEKNNVKD